MMGWLENKTIREYGSLRSSGSRMLTVHVCIVSALLNTFALAFYVFVIVVHNKVIGSNQHSLLNVAVSAAVLILFFDLNAKLLKAAWVGQIIGTVIKRDGRQSKDSGSYLSNDF